MNSERIALTKSFVMICDMITYALVIIKYWSVKEQNLTNKESPVLSSIDDNQMCNDSE